MLELIAKVQHQIWAHWMNHVFTNCGHTDTNGNFVIKEQFVGRWKSQICKDYEELSSTEQASDRRQAWKIIDAILNRLAIFLMLGFGVGLLTTTLIILT